MPIVFHFLVSLFISFVCMNFSSIFSIIISNIIMLNSETLKQIEVRRNDQLKVYRLVHDIAISEVSYSIAEFNVCCQQLDVSTYCDIEEERFLADICGYPICSNAIIRQPTPPVYRIIDKKLYDVTVRKYFCSDQCYVASQSLKEQLPTEPLWITGVRKYIEYRIAMPSVVVGVPGLFVDVKRKLDQDNDTIGHNLSGLQIEDITSTENVDQYDPGVDETIVDDLLDDIDKMQDDDDCIESSSEEDELIIGDGKDALDGWLSKSSNKTPQNSQLLTNPSSDGLASTVKRIQQKHYEPKKKLGTLKPKVKPVTIIDAPRMASGNSREKSKHFASTNIASKSVRKDVEMNLFEEMKSIFVSYVTLKTTKFIKGNVDPFTPIDEEESKGDSMFRPVESDFEKRVNKFFTGNIVEKETTAVILNEDDQTQFRVPIMDHLDQRAHRYAIFSHQLSKVWPVLLSRCNLQRDDVIDQVRKLMLTFELTAKNIAMPKSDQWCVIAVFVVVVLWRRYEYLTETSILEDRNCGIWTDFNMIELEQFCSELNFGLKQCVDCVNELVK